MNTAAHTVQYTASEDDQPTGQVTDYLERLGKALEAAAGAVDRLEARLVPVLATVPEEGATRAEVSAVIQLAPLAHALAEVVDQVDSIYRHVALIERRCEL